MYNLLPDVLHQQLGDLGEQLTVPKHVKPQVTNIVLQHISVEGELDQVFKDFRGRDLKEWRVSSMSGKERFESSLFFFFRVLITFYFFISSLIMVLKWTTTSAKEESPGPTLP